MADSYYIYQDEFVQDIVKAILPDPNETLIMEAQQNLEYQIEPMVEEDLDDSVQICTLSRPQSISEEKKP